MINFDKGISSLRHVKESNKKIDKSIAYFTFSKFSKHLLTASKSKGITKLFLLIALFCLHTLKSANYYFSSISGNDSYSSIQAKSPLTPWKSLSKLNSFMGNIQAGDSILFKRGEIFYGSLIINKSGTAANPIVFSTYGTGAKPILSGLTTLSNWTAQGVNKWEADCPSCGTSVNMLLINESPQSLGRYPNTTDSNKGYLTFESNGSLQISDSELPALPDWTGAEVVIRSSRWTMDRRLISSHVGTQINFSPTTTYPLTNNYGYFIQNHPLTLDTYGEWYYNLLTKKILVYTDSNNPSSLSISVATQNILVTLNNTNYIHINGIEFLGANTTALNCNASNYVSITHCDFNFSGADALSGGKLSYFTFENSIISNTNNNAVSLNPSNNTVLKNNFIKNTGTAPGRGKSGTGAYIGIILSGNNNLIEYNTINNTGYIPICFQGSSILIKNNFINDFAFTLDDGGGIYTWNGCPSNPGTMYGINHFDRKITGNIVLYGVGAPEGTNSNNSRTASGIYLDDNTMNVEVSNNIIANCALFGVFLHNARENSIIQNTVFNNNVQLAFSENGDCTTDPIINNKIENNILFSKLSTQSILGLYANTINNRSDYATFDYNYYCRPFDEENTITVKNSYDTKNYNLLDWKNSFNKDLNSQITPLKFSNYVINELIGPNKYANGEFNSNIDGSASWSPQGNCKTTWNNTAALDSSSLKFSFSSVSGQYNKSILTFNIGIIDSTKKYILKYRLKGVKTGQKIEVNLRQLSTPYTKLSSFQTCKIFPDWKEEEFLFSPNTNANNSCIQFIIDEADSTLYFDNIELYEADATLINPDDCIRIEYNATHSNKTIPLEEDYVDVKNNLYSGSVTLPPFASVVLLKKIPNTISKKKNNSNETILYPNPFNDFIYMENDKIIKQALLYTIEGEIIMSVYPNAKWIEIKTSLLAKGLYFVKSNIEGNWITKKVIKQ
jgi:parallel beta-helix repeat protein